MAAACYLELTRAARVVGLLIACFLAIVCMSVWMMIVAGPCQYVRMADEASTAKCASWLFRIIDIDNHATSIATLHPVSVATLSHALAHTLRPTAATTPPPRTTLHVLPRPRHLPPLHPDPHPLSYSQTSKRRPDFWPRANGTDEGGAMRGAKRRLAGKGARLRGGGAHRGWEYKPVPSLPDSYGPWNQQWSNSIALCTIIREENATDVREWLQYHKWLGIDHVYLTENHSRQPIRDALSDHIESGFVTYEVVSEPHAQLRVYRRCVRRHRKRYNWLAFFDVDEFLLLRDWNATLKQFLDRYKPFPGLAVHWIFMGANDLQARPTSGGVLRHYTKCWPQPLKQVKIIANTFFIQDVAQHPYNLFFRGRAAPVNEARHPVPYRFLGRSCRRGQPSCTITAGHEQGQPSVEHIVLYHYVTRSLEDFQIKARRGGGNNHNGKPFHFFESIQQNQTSDAICTEISKLADTCCPLAS